MSSPGSSTSSASSASSSSIVFDPNTLVQPPIQLDLPPPPNPTHAPGSAPPATLDSSSQSTVAFTLSGFTNNALQSQNTAFTSVANTQSSAPNPSQPALKSAHATVPSRGWMSQRRGKAIHIDDDQQSLRNELAADAESDLSDQHTTSPSSQRIIELGVVEEQLGQLLNLASDVLGALGPPLDGDESTNSAIEHFSSSINEYFELLNKIQSRLRTSMSYLRVSRVSTRVLFEPAHVAIPHCPVGLGDLKLTPNHTGRALGPGLDTKEDDEPPSLSLGSLVAERNAWKDFVESLELIKAQRTPL